MYFVVFLRQKYNFQSRNHVSERIWNWALFCLLIQVLFVRVNLQLWPIIAIRFLSNHKILGILDVIEFQKPSFKHVRHIIIILIIQPDVKSCHVISSSRVLLQSFQPLLFKMVIFNRKRHQIAKSTKYGLSSDVLILNKNTLSIKESHHRLFWRSINFYFGVLTVVLPWSPTKSAFDSNIYTYRCLAMFISCCLRHV